MDLQGKNIVYVGGFGGIGFAACKALVMKNIANLVIMDIKDRQDLLNELKSFNPSVNVQSLKMDLTNIQSIVASLMSTVLELKYIDVLVNGSGVVNEKNVELTVGVNLIGLINMTISAIPLMDKSLSGRGGVIINVASLLGLEPAPPSAIYSATKHGVVGFTRSLSHEYYYQRTGIAMMTFCPGLTVTSLLDNYQDTGLTFPYSKEVQGTIMDTKSQTAAECALNLVEAIESGRNGIVWKSDGGQLEEVIMVKFWERHE